MDFFWGELTDISAKKRSAGDMKADVLRTQQTLRSFQPGLIFDSHNLIRNERTGH